MNCMSAGWGGGRGHIDLFGATMFDVGQNGCGLGQIGGDGGRVGSKRSVSIFARSCACMLRSHRATLLPRSGGEPASRPTNEPTNQTLKRPATQSVNQPASQPTSHPPQLDRAEALADTPHPPTAPHPHPIRKTPHPAPSPTTPPRPTPQHIDEDCVWPRSVESASVAVDHGKHDLAEAYEPLREASPPISLDALRSYFVEWLGVAQGLTPSECVDALKLLRSAGVDELGVPADSTVDTAGMLYRELAQASCVCPGVLDIHLGPPQGVCRSLLGGRAVGRRGAARGVGDSCAEIGAHSSDLDETRARCRRSNLLAEGVEAQRRQVAIAAEAYKTTSHTRDPAEVVELALSAEKG